MKHPIPDHERIFDEICGKLNELSQRGETQTVDPWADKIEKMQSQLKRSQDELKTAQSQIQEKIRTLDSVPVPAHDSTQELKRLTEQLEIERQNNSKVSQDLAKSLELNLKLQFEIEEVKSKSHQVISEERKHNQYFAEKNKSLNGEMELLQALNSEIRNELSKAKEKFSSEGESWVSEKAALIKDQEDLFNEHDQVLKQHEEILKRHEDVVKEADKQKALIEQQNAKLQEVEMLLEQKQNEIQKVTETIGDFEKHSVQQHDAMKSLSSVAEKKIVELKMALDRKAVECQDYYSHLQQSLAQTAILKQENVALKEYISKISGLQQSNARPPEVRA